MRQDRQIHIAASVALLQRLDKFDPGLDSWADSISPPDARRLKFPVAFAWAN